ncbi:MAG: periplasmic heavy metal sensor [Deltaproteobacteria bacterium]|jgi:Spy/CpxP family protein refolding chaperone|nr:periplasmic heavy metal sensor [Deltaproteobacteria bacterium]
MLKKPFLAILGFFLVLALVSPALAQPRDRDLDDRDDPGDRFQLTEEQKKAWDKVWSDFQDRVYPIRSQLRDKRLLYRVLADQTAVNIEEVKIVIADMSKLRDQLRTEFKKFKEDLKTAKLPDILAVHGRGGPGNACFDDFDGHRPGFGRGHHRSFDRDDRGDRGDRGDRDFKGRRGHDKDRKRFDRD